jgi:uncharacterized protein (DUF2141 family)
MPVKDLFVLEKSEEFCIEKDEEKDLCLKLKRCCDIQPIIVAGRVTSCGKPIANAVVKIFDEKLCPIAHTLTNCEGRYAFVYCLKAGCFKIAATAEDHEVSKVVSLELKECDEKVVNFDLKKECCDKKGVLYGEVENKSAHCPVDEALIYLFEKDTMCHVAQTLSNKYGQYLFLNLKPGKYEIRAYKQWFEMTEPRVVFVEPCVFTKADIELVPYSCEFKNTVSGVIFCDGHPLCGAVAALYQIEKEKECLVQIKTTNEDGLYLFYNLKPGKYVVKAKMQNGAEFFNNHEIDD